MIKFVIICLLVIIALALAAGQAVRRAIARILGLPHK